MNAHDACEQAYKNGYEAALKAAKEKQWISTSERLPETDEYVLVVASGTKGNMKLIDAIEIATYYIEDDCWELAWLTDVENLRVTYWMPLPEAPESEVEEYDL